MDSVKYETVKNVSAKCGNHLMDPFNFPLNEKVVQGWLLVTAQFRRNVLVTAIPYTTVDTSRN